MAKTKISQKRSISSFVWSSSKAYKWFVLLILQAPFIAAFSIPVSQYANKLIIDIIVEKPVFEIGDLSLPIMLFMGALISLETCWKVSDLANYKVLPLIRADMIYKAYSYITGHSYEFFSSNLSGNISSKVNNLEEVIIRIFDNIKFNIIESAMAIVISLCFLYLVSVKLAILATLFCLVFFPTIFILSKRINILSIDYTNYRQRTAGLIVDSISNINSVFLFAGKKRERKSIGQGLVDLISSEKKMLRYEFFLGLFITAIYVVTIVSVLFLL
ncbi:MAG: ABC transporter transmembrane domain-containing protein, partial [Proteobacteria bacterium]|nr:ABC transporter transmembrane domain-containing protein [Pseudomonadota bacterium]